jgi:hypothetical protein
MHLAAGARVRHVAAKFGGSFAAAHRFGSDPRLTGHIIGDVGEEL